MPSKKISKKPAKSKSPKKEIITPMVSEEVVEAPSKIALPELKLNPKILAGAAILIGVGVLTYKLGPWLVPAIVDKTPITRWQLYTKLDQAYGAQALDDMINEKVLDLVLQKSGVTVDDARVNEQITSIEKQFETTGGLDAALEARSMTRDDLKKQIKTQLLVEEVLKDQINPTQEEVKNYFDENAETLFKDQKIEDVEADIKETLKQTKLRDAFMNWFSEAKKEINVKNFSLPL